MSEETQKRAEYDLLKASFEKALNEALSKNKKNTSKILI